MDTDVLDGCVTLGTLLGLLKVISLCTEQEIWDRIDENAGSSLAQLSTSAGPQRICRCQDLRL